MRSFFLVKKISHTAYQRGKALYIAAFIWLVSVQMAQADGVIPISPDDKTASGSNFGQELVKIFQKDILPFIELAGGVLIVWQAITTMVGGVREAQEKQKFDPLKNAIIKVAIVVVVGGALLYLLDTMRSHAFS
tara:strand:- start:808 stop:1209 length:402 start_codon:yes stop_codon:yes gene_type:complete